MRREDRKFTRSAKTWVFILAVAGMACTTSCRLAVPMTPKPRACSRPCPITSQRSRQYRLH